MEAMAVELPKVDGKFIQMEDEIGSIAAVIGAAWAGAKAMTATSGPGLALMVENIGYAIMTETPCVIVDVQRAGPSTGQATKPASGDLMQVRWGAPGDYEIIALSPASVYEMYEMTVKAFNLSEQYRIPVFLLADEAVGHLKESVNLPPDISVVPRSDPASSAGRREGDLPPFGNIRDNTVTPIPAFGQGRKLSVTGSTHDEWGYRRTQSPEAQARLIDRFCNKIRSNIDKIVEREEYFIPPGGTDTEVLVITYGFTARSALRAVKIARDKGIKAGFIRLKTVWPFDENLFKRKNWSALKRVIVPEMNQGQLIREVQRFAPQEVKVIPFNKTDGTVITPKEILERLKD
jgi:2-oxoglutarate ferredoxin oxidoreductase subunit alpha